MNPQIVITARVPRGATFSEDQGYEEFQFVYQSQADLADLRTELTAAIGRVRAVQLTIEPQIPSSLGPVTLRAASPGEVPALIEYTQILASYYTTSLP